MERLGRVPQIRETIDYVRKIRSIYKPESSATLVSATAERADSRGACAAATEAAECHLQQRG